MKNTPFKLQDFELEKMSKESQKTITAGSPPTPPEEPTPIRGTGSGNG